MGKGRGESSGGWGGQPCVGVGDSSPTNGPVVQRLARPSGIRETRGSIPGLAFSFLLPLAVHYQFPSLANVQLTRVTLAQLIKGFLEPNR